MAYTREFLDLQHVFVFRILHVFTEQFPSETFCGRWVILEIYGVHCC